MGERPRHDRPSRSEPFDWSQPAFEPQEVRDRAVDALPYNAKQRRAMWWQIAAMALVADVVTVALIVQAATGSTTVPLGLAVLSAPAGALFTWAAWRTRRLRRPRTSTS